MGDTPTDTVIDDVIERFDRFPHRNAVLNRENTPEEQAFLAGPEGEFWGA